MPENLTPPWLQGRNGPELLAEALLDAARSPEEWPGEQRACVYWAMTSRGALRQRRRRTLARAGAVGGALLLAVAGLSRSLLDPGPLAGSARGEGPVSPGAATSVENPARRAAEERALDRRPGAPETARAQSANAASGSRSRAERETPAAPHGARMAFVRGAEPGEDARGPLAWTLIHRAGLGSLETNDATRLELRDLAAGVELVLDAGTLRAEVSPQDPLRPVRVVTPHMRVVVVGTRFDVRVADERSEVEVVSGMVRVERASHAVLLAAGETIRSDDERLGAPERPETVPPAPPAALSAVRRPRPPARPRPAPSLASCADAPSLAEQKACYVRFENRPDLSGENALLALGLIAREEGRPEVALAYWRLYEERFPQGALAPEVALAAFEVLLEQRRAEEAILAARQFEERFQHDARAPGVALARAKLLCANPQRRHEGRALLDQIGAAAEVDAELRAAAERQRPKCARVLGASGGD